MKQQIKQIIKDMPLIIKVLIAILFLLLAFFIIDGVASKEELYNGYVVEKYYKPKRNANGIGYVISGRGGIVLTSEYESENFILIVRTINGSIVSAICTPELYYNKQVGDAIQCKVYKGFFTNETFSIIAIK